MSEPQKGKLLKPTIDHTRRAIETSLQAPAGANKTQDFSKWRLFWKKDVKVTMRQKVDKMEDNPAASPPQKSGQRYRTAIADNAINPSSKLLPTSAVMRIMGKWLPPSVEEIDISDCPVQEPAHTADCGIYLAMYALCVMDENADEMFNTIALYADRNSLVHTSAIHLIETEEFVKLGAILLQDLIDLPHVTPQHIQHLVPRMQETLLPLAIAQTPFSPRPVATPTTRISIVISSAAISHPRDATKTDDRELLRAIARKQIQRETKLDNILQRPDAIIYQPRSRSRTFPRATPQRLQQQ
ncbi:hypothetical protein CONLIGDRAFT_677997 [Coniochaeta ligniaria NRRL 30616]|uniref:Uncharacterized protein n=1 Tax=Coniochaeta ligniaria NRRL 30616 TaxID=1408157 RepID=A0A1J7IWH8_9PEZI|nr:hypothetical protein CONLIGDRAFT_677997 [Coniochaeta ligniaria NRRL 30616]